MDLILWLNLSRHHHWNFCFWELILYSSCKAVCVQLIFGIFFAVRATGVIESVAVCEIIYIVIAALSLAATWTELKTYMPDDLEKFLGKPDPTRKNGGPKNQPPHKMPKIVMPKD